MSLGEGSRDRPPRGTPPAGADDAAADRRTALRATAHPVRLQIMSLLTGAPLTAAEVARELALTHANASYHLRTLLAAGMIVPAGEERIRGGIAKRYRYDTAHDLEAQRARGRTAADRAIYPALANELIRRSAQAHFPAGGTNLMADAEVWVDPELWRDIRDRIAQAARDLHDAAQPPRTPGTVRTSTTVAMFEMAPIDPDQPA
ncbi:helix-turn-helix domain-containing protein [Krasilnikovia sp. MM14-A1259]|uniref:helix-turn-helix domain-containing protein n=1 Tax=Krasilnikovia sp. MM14-A1259 TaxID=3373539 RepID=UPI00380B4B17